MNDACVLSGKPNAYGSIFRFEGQASVFGMPDGPCYRCLYPEPPPPGLVPSCAEGGVLGILRDWSAWCRRPRVIKLILGIGETLAGRLLLVDALTMRFRQLKLRKNPDCPVCGTHPTVTELIDYDQFCGIPKPTETGPLEVSSHKAVSGAVVDGIPQITPEELKRRLDAKEDVFVLDVREPHEYAIVNIGATLIPLGEVALRSVELGDKDRSIVVHCKSGARSQKAAVALKNAGFTHVENLSGGILGWGRIRSIRACRSTKGEGSTKDAKVARRTQRRTSLGVLLLFAELLAAALVAAPT